MDVGEEYGIAPTWEVLIEEMLQWLEGKHFKVWMKMQRIRNQ